MTAPPLPHPTAPGDEQGTVAAARKISRYFDGLLWIDPSAPEDRITSAVLPDGEVVSAAYPCHVVVERRRVRDRQTGKRHMANVRVGHFLLTGAPVGEAVLGRDEARKIYMDAKAARVDEIHVYGQRAYVFADSITFHQFGVRDLATLPAAGTAS